MESIPPSEAFTLKQAKTGQELVIMGCTDENTQMQLLRLGLSHGQQVQLVAVIPGGPFIIRMGETEIALGRLMAADITVTRV